MVNYIPILFFFIFLFFLSLFLPWRISLPFNYLLKSQLAPPILSLWFCSSQMSLNNNLYFLKKSAKAEHLKYTIFKHKTQQPMKKKISLTGLFQIKRTGTASFFSQFNNSRGNNTVSDLRCLYHAFSHQFRPYTESSKTTPKSWMPEPPSILVGVACVGWSGTV